MLSWFRILILLLLQPLSVLAQNNTDIFVQLGHSGDILAVAFSPDGRTLVSGSGDHTLKLWDVASGRELRTLRHDNYVSAVAISPDGRTIVSGGGDTLKLWDVSTGRELHTLNSHAGRVTSVAFSPDGRTVVSGNLGNTLELWDITRGQMIRTLAGHTNYVLAVAFSPDGRTLVSGSGDHTLKLWDVASGRELRTLRHDNYVSAVAISPDGRTLASGSWDHTLKLWDVTSGRELHTLLGHSSLVRAITFSPDGRTIVSGGDDKTLKLWDVASRRELRTLSGHTHKVSAVAFSPDGHTIVSGSDDQTLRLWDVAAGQQKHALQRASAPISSVGFDPKGLVIVAGSSDQSIKVWSRYTQQPPLILRGSARITAVAQSPDGKFLAIGSSDGAIKLADFEAGEDVVLQGHIGEVTSLAFSPNGKLLASGSRDKTIRFWNLASKHQQRVLHGHTSGALGKLGLDEGGISIAFSPDGKMLVSGGWDNSVRFWEVATGHQLHVLQEHTHPVTSVAFHPNGRYLASGSGDALKLWDISSTRSLRTLRHGIGVWSVAFSPDGKFLASSAQGSIKLWDFPSGQERRVLRPHGETMATSVAFSPDGKFLVSGGVDGATRYWNVAAGEELASFVGFVDREWIVMTPQGYYMGSDKADQYVNVRIGNRVYGVDQYREKFYRPEIVLAALAGKPITGLASLTSVRPAPSVSIVETPASVGSDEATVKVKVADEGGGIGDVRLYLNGSAVVLDRSRNLAVSKVQGKAQTFSYKVRLVPGKNAIRAIAFNAENSMQSMDALYEIEARIAAKKPSLHALVIGIQEYENPKLTLKYPAADARLIATTLREQATGLFERVNIVELTAKPQTTKEAIAKTLKEMSDKVRPDDLFVFFVASHGTVDEGEYYLITSNVGALSTHILKKSALSQDDLKAMIANVPATKKLVIIDTCNAGKLGEALHVAMLTRGMNEETAMKILSRAVGSTVLSASNSVQEALEGYKGHGLFTWVVTEGLKGAADSDKDGYVKTHELVNYVDDKVPVLAEQVFKHKQYPTTTLSGQGFPVVKVK